MHVPAAVSRGPRGRWRAGFDGLRAVAGTRRVRLPVCLPTLLMDGGMEGGVWRRTGGGRGLQEEEEHDDRDGRGDSDDGEAEGHEGGHEAAHGGGGRRKGKGGKKAAAHVGDEVEMRIYTEPATRCGGL